MQLTKLAPPQPVGVQARLEGRFANHFSQVGDILLAIVPFLILLARDVETNLYDSVNMVSTVPESVNGHLNCKANQKARHWDDAACIAEEGEEDMF